MKSVLIYVFLSTEKSCTFAIEKATTMNKLIISLFFVFTLLSAQSFAQDVKGIKRSDKTEMINGTKFYIHTVKKGQTAYSISKAYGVKVEDIYQNNPGSEQGLQLDQQLKIPVLVKAIGHVEPVQDSLSADGKFIYHRVERGETLYRIMKHFNVNQDVLVANNPGLNANLHPGDIIKIPTQDNLISEKAQALYSDLEEYKVKKKDTYYKLEKKYAVNQQQLEQLNPQLVTNGLQKGMIIFMPKGLKKLATIPTFIEIKADTVLLEGDPLASDSIFAQLFDCDSLIARNDTFRIAIMIPFYANLEKEIRTSSSYYAKKANSYKSFTFIQFYEGFLIALDSIKQLGFNAEVYVYDTKADTATVRQIIQKHEFESLDLIIGPLFNANVKLVLEAVEENNTKVISPFSRESDLVQNHPNLFKVAPSTTSIIKSSCEWVADSLPNARILVIHDDKKSQVQVVELMKKSFNQHAGNGIDTNEVFFYSYKKDGVSKMLKNLSPDHKNVIVNLVNNEAEISNFLRVFNPKSEDYQIYLIGSELNWKRFETLEIKYLVDLHLTQCTSHFIDHTDTTVFYFEKRFINRYETVPSTLAFNGFDISWFFLNALYYYGPGFESCMNKLNVHTMSTKYIFKKNGEGGYENTYLNMYQYNNYKLVNKRQP